MLTLNDGRSELWQWDTGRTLAVDADCSQVHFSNKVFGRSIDVDVVDGVAIIPDILLQTDNELNVWAFVGTADNGYTKISKTFKVNRRNKPADYVFTPTEQTTLSKLVDRLDKIEESQSPEAIKNVVDDYLEQNPVEIPVQSVNGQTGAVELTAEDVGAIADETDPTVPEWAKQPTKPTYTAAEVGALPDTYTPPNQTAQQVGADPAGTAASAVSQHNTDDTSHNDLRLALQELSDRINAALDSDDTTLDQMSEVVAYIKSNKSMIDAITTSKVNVSDIVNNLTTDISNKPLSAAQGVALKELINALSNSMTAYRTAAAQDVIDSGKVDKVTGKGLSSNDYTDAAKAKVDALAPVATSGNYNDLSNKPTIPTAYDDTEVRQRIGAIEAKESTWDAKSNFSGSYNDLTNKPVIPNAVTEQTVSGWGFTKNTGTYSKPTGGIPKADLASAVQASLGKADSALQNHQDLSAYAKKTEIPTVPTKVSAFTNDSEYQTAAQVNTLIDNKLGNIETLLAAI